MEKFMYDSTQKAPLGRKYVIYTVKHSTFYDILSLCNYAVNSIKKNLTMRILEVSLKEMTMKKTLRKKKIRHILYFFVYPVVFKLLVCWEFKYLNRKNDNNKVITFKEEEG